VGGGGSRQAARIREVAARVEAHCKILRLERKLGDRNRQLELVRDRILHSISP
jgi:hypothetical protein